MDECGGVVLSLVVAMAISDGDGVIAGKKPVMPSKLSLVRLLFVETFTILFSCFSDAPDLLCKLIEDTSCILSN